MARAMWRAAAADILTWLRENTTHVAPGAISGTPIQLVRHIHHTSDLYVVRIGRGQGAVRLVAKRSFEDEGPIEMRNFVRFNASAPVALVRCPEPVAYAKNVRVLFTKYEPGVTVATMIQRGQAFGIFGGTQLTEAVRLSGLWLAHWHSGANKSGWAPIPEKDVQQVWAAIRALDVHPNWCFRAETRSRIVDVVHRILARRRTTAVQTTLVHGDFGPSNVHATNDGVRILDMVEERRGPVYDDVGGMLAGLAIMCSMRAVPASHARALALAFLNAYVTGTGVDLNRSVLAFYSVKSLLRYAVGHASRVARLPRGLIGFGKAAVTGLYDRLVQAAIDVVVRTGADELRLGEDPQG